MYYNHYECCQPWPKAQFECKEIPCCCCVCVICKEAPYREERYPEKDFREKDFREKDDFQGFFEKLNDPRIKEILRGNFMN